MNHARGSPTRLFLLVYLAGTVVTIFLSNDATAVVLTPAVLAAAKKADTNPLPLLFVCAFIANAASFVLPISNPANLVLYGNHMPALAAWLERFALPSLLSILATCAALHWTQRRELAGRCRGNPAQARLGASGRVALGGIAMTAVALLLVSAFDIPLGLPTALLGVLTAAVVLLRSRASPGHYSNTCRGVRCRWSLVCSFLSKHSIAAVSSAHSRARWEKPPRSRTSARHPRPRASSRSPAT